MLMTYQLHGRCMWHTDCKKSLDGRGDGIMKQIKREREHDLFKCLHCGVMGYYPVGGVGTIEVDEE